jgi:predicted nucleic acid-binding protein
MTSKVLDSYALLAFFRDEPGADLVRDLILKAEENKVTLYISVVNLGEVWYSIARTNSPEIADQYINTITGMAIEVIEADWQLTRQAALFKANGNISYADCFAAALAKLKKAELITGDKEFKPLDDVIKISWV